MNWTSDYEREEFCDYLRGFLPDDFEPLSEKKYFETAVFENVTKLGKCETLDVDVYEFESHSATTAQVSITREVARLMKKYGTEPNLLAVFFNKNEKQWRFSLVTTSYYRDEKGNLKTAYSSPRRFSFLLGEGCKTHTVEQMLSETVLDADDLKSRFSVEAVTKEFYNTIFAWYEWAVKLAKYPEGSGANVKMTQEGNEIAIIRLITRIMFVWFIKQKKLIPDWIFSEKDLQAILSDFDAKSATSGNYYNAVLQNLFFATLNNEICDRQFTNTQSSGDQYGIKTFYRDDAKKSFFTKTQNEIVALFHSVPYLNGGLFKCLDYLQNGTEGVRNVQVYIDGFSREKGRRAFLPNILFFGDEKHEGIIAILNRYNFTVQENTPLEVQVALDPELLGKVFENLLASFNPETNESARKDSGSFYTPREIVNYMVDESLKTFLKNAFNDSDSKLNALFDDASDENPFSEDETKTLLGIIHSLKVLDPACGSGAFPVGVLHRLVALEQKLRGDDGRSPYQMKLDIIKNNIYGVDIQSIAVQITKLRFFISLVCEEVPNDDASDNYGIQTLPNLETKFVVANTLVGLEKNQDNLLDFDDHQIEELQNELQKVRNESVTVCTAKESYDNRAEDDRLSGELLKFITQQKVYNHDDAIKIASYHPHNPNSKADFFDTQTMFAFSGGFDIVLGNPPYISTKGVAAQDKKRYEKEFGFSDDTYNLFWHKGLSLAKQNGIVCFITPKTFWTTQTKRNMRDLLLSKTIIQIFDTANPFESAMVDTCITTVCNTPCNKNHKVRFLDGTKDLKTPQELNATLQSTFCNTQNSVIFMPTPLNLKIQSLYGEKVKELYDTWWEKIKTSRDIEKNKVALEAYRKSLKPGDVALLGCLTDGGVGLQTGNNGKYIAVRSSTKWAENIRQTRPKKLKDAIKAKGIKIAGLENSDTKEFLENKTEKEIAKLFDDLKEKYGRDIFGQGYIYKIIGDSEIADVDSLTQDEKDNGIETTKKYYVPYDKGDKDGNRWYLETPFAIAWSRENVRFLKTNSGKKGEGMPVVRNPQFYFREGFCWIDVSKEYIKSRVKSKGVFDVLSMSLYTMTQIPDWYFVSLINSRFIGIFVNAFINNTCHFQINDARKLPIIIPDKETLQKIESLASSAISIKKAQKANAEKELAKIQKELDTLVSHLYHIDC